MTGRPWMLVLSFLAFPPAGLLARAAAGPVDGPLAALVAGAVVGLVVGGAQWLALRAALPGQVRAAWIPATALAMSLGLTAASAAGLSTTDRVDLVGIGLVQGAVLGLVQSRLMPAGLRRTWALVVPAAWTIAWQVTVSFGVDISVGWAVFGASGALFFSTVLAATLALCGRRVPTAQVAA